MLAITPEPTVSRLTALGRWLHQRLCGLRGHDALLHFGVARLSLQCMSCGYKTRGWDLWVDRKTARAVTATRANRCAGISGADGRKPTATSATVKQGITAVVARQSLSGRNA